MHSIYSDSFFFLDDLLRAFKASCIRYSICPLVLRNSSAAQLSSSLSTSGFIRNTNAFFSAIVLVCCGLLLLAHQCHAYTY